MNFHNKSTMDISPQEWFWNVAGTYWKLNCMLKDPVAGLLNPKDILCPILLCSISVQPSQPFILLTSSLDLTSSCIFYWALNPVDVLAFNFWSASWSKLAVRGTEHSGMIPPSHPALPVPKNQMGNVLGI